MFSYTAKSQFTEHGHKMHARPAEGNRTSASRFSSLGSRGPSKHTEHLNQDITEQQRASTPVAHPGI